MKTGAIVVGLGVLLVAFLSFIVRPSATRLQSGSESAKLVFRDDATGFTGGEPVFFRGVLVGHTTKPVIEGQFAVVRIAFNSSAPKGLPPCTEFEAQSADPRSRNGRSLTGHPPVPPASSTGCKANIFAVNGQGYLVSEYWNWYVSAQKQLERRQY